MTLGEHHDALLRETRKLESLAWDGVRGVRPSMVAVRTVAESIIARSHIIEAADSREQRTMLPRHPKGVVPTHDNDSPPDAA